ncbi:MAG TPA: U32 family peptidase, partial [Thermoplasmata archaeon]|nr:U32 family peptidase [Thermoplasmata archaeon]
MELVVASNFDDRLIERTATLPIAAFFGGYRVQLTGGGRPPQILPEVDREAFRWHVACAHSHGRKFL